MIDLRKFNSPDTDLSEPVEALYFDGYAIAERLLEGLVIKVTLTEDSEDIIITADWPKGIDKSQMEIEARNWALYTDSFATTPELKDDDGYLTVLW